MNLALSLAAAVAYVAGGVCMKLSAGLTKLGPSVMIFVCFCLGATLQTISMRKAELGVNYILVLGLEATLAFVCGVLIFGESYSYWKILGMILGGLLQLRK